MSQCGEQEPIAIVGAACRLPGDTTSLGRLWDMISHGKTAHGKVPASRWDADVWYHPDPDRKGSISVKHGYFLEQDVALFDAPFFSMTAKEAAGMDPMKRLLLEVSYEGFENAGIPVDSLMNSQTGVYVGCMTNDYEQLSTNEIYDIGDVAASGMSEAMTANRVSWFFGLRGPSLTLDTACSSSLYALHLACQSLKLGETNMGLVAGVNLILHPNFMHQLSSMHMLSPEGISHSFDHRANGYGRGEGIGCLIVKRLKDAIRDGDTIRAVIRGTGTNADGKTPGITQPSSEAQAELIRTTYEAAGLPLSDTQYFEAHGTGTALGDPIELSAIGATLGKGRPVESGPLYVGSIKANVGHTEGCSGLAGVLKSIVCLEKGILVPTAGIETVNPKLKLADWNLSLPSENMSWPSSGQRRVSVNSFGFGGANAHVILDDAYHYLRSRGLSGNHTTCNFEDDASESAISMGSDSPRQDARKMLFAFSTKDQGGLDRLGPLYADFLSKKETTSSPRFLGDVAYTLSQRRAHFEFRSFAVAESVADLEAQLFAKGLPKTKRLSKHDNPIFVFTGQGAQWPAMGRELLDNCIFRTSIHKSQVLLEHYGCPWDLVDELCRIKDSNVDLPQYSQVLCTVLQIGLVDLLRGWGITPKAVVGHSSGEIGAAYAAGLLSRCNAVRVAYLRGVCSAKVADMVSPRVGAMLAAGLSEQEATGYLEKVPSGSAVVACVNSPSSVTLSGDRDSIVKLCELISADGKFARMLRVKTAYHSPHMATVANEYVDRMGVIIPLPDEDQVAPMFSSLTGSIVTSRDLDASYWMRNMCEQVRFSQAMSNLLGHAPDSIQGRSRNRVQWSAFVEIGPHGALQSPVGEIVKSSQSKAAKEAPYFSAITRGKDAETTAMQLAGQLWASGHSIHLLRVNGIMPESLPMALPDLPSYPWNHSKGYWHEAAVAKSRRFPSGPRTDLLGVPVDLQNPMEPRWRNYLRISENPWIEDHRITSTTLYPAAGMIVMAIEAARQLADATQTLKGFAFHDLKFERGLVVPSRGQAVQTEISLHPDHDRPGMWTFTVFSTLSGDSWTKHCHGSLAIVYDDGSNHHSSPSETEWHAMTTDWTDIKAQASEQMEMETLYDELEAVGVEYGPTFRNVFEAAAIPGQHCAHGAVAIPDTISSMPFNFEYPHLIHPATMDAIFHLLFVAFSDGKPLDEAAVPYTLKDMYISADLPQGEGSVYTGYARRLRTDGRETSGDLVVSDESWSGPKLIVCDFALRQVTSSRDRSSNAKDASRRVCAKVRWKEDVDFIRSADELCHLTGASSLDEPRENRTDCLGAISQLLDRMHHKRPGFRALLVVSDAGDSSRNALHDLVSMLVIDPEAQGNRSRNLSVITTDEETRDMVQTFLSDRHVSADLNMWDPQRSDVLLSDEDKVDLVLAVGSDYDYLENSSAVSQFCHSTCENGHIGILHLDANTSTSFSAIEKAFTNSNFSLGPSIRDGTSHQAFLLCRKASAAAQPPLPKDIYILQASQPSLQSQALESVLVNTLGSLGCRLQTTTLQTTELLQGKHVISLLEIESPLVYRWTTEEFSHFKRLVSGAAHLFWITCGGLMQDWKDGLEFAPSQGLLRVMRTEYSHITLPHLDLSRNADLGSKSTANTIIGVWNASLHQDPRRLEMEYAELNGSIFVPRFLEDDGIDTDIDQHNGTLKPIKGSLRSGTPQQLIREDRQLIWVEDEASTAPMDPHNVEVLVRQASLRHQTRSSSGAQPFPFSMFSAVGTVSATGPDVKNVSVGQAVVALQSGPCRTTLRVHESLVRPIPPNMKPEEIVSILPALMLAQYAVMEVSRLDSSQTVLVHGADTAVGQVALQLALSVNTVVFATIRDHDARKATSKTLGIAPDRLFEHVSRDCQTSIMNHTNGSGVDVVVNCNSAFDCASCLDCLADFGTLVDLTRDSDARQSSATSSRQNATVVKADVYRLLQAKSVLAVRLFNDALDLIESGKIVSVSEVSVRSLIDLEHLVEDSSREDMVLHLDREARVLMRPSRIPELQLDCHGTYVLAGGLGALGLQIAEMIFQHGAGHVVFLSRSGGDKNRAELEDLTQRGLRVDAFKCDVSDASHVKDVVKRLEEQGCRVKGVIQCAMVLEDAIFENMTYDQWQRSTRPKIQGTMNLHNSMPKDVDFFILLSSITCVIGNAAQSNYAAGNTFEDAFAHYRRSQGLAATAIDVGLVTDSAHFTGDFDMHAYLQMYEHRWDGLQTTQQELDIVLRAAMRGTTADGRPVEPQIVLGLGSSMSDGPEAASWTRDAKFGHRVSHGSAASSGGVGGGLSAAQRIGKAETLQDAVAVVEETLKMYAAQAMDVLPDEVDAEKAFYDFGVDSLKAVELRNRIFRDLQSDMSVFELLSPSPLSKLAVEIAGRSKLVVQVEDKGGSS